MQVESQDGTMTLVEVADQLRHKEIDAIVSGYRERSVSLKRTILVAIAITWALYWSRGAITVPPDGWKHLPLGQVLPIEATNLLPWLLVILPVCIAWMSLVRLGKIRETEFVDGVGAVANHVIIGVMLWFAWNLTLATVTVLPIISIVIGARFGKRYFFLSMLMSCLVVGISAPEGYWVKRPAFAVFAIVLLIGIPLTVNKLLATLWAISAQAVRSRDAQNRFIATMSHELRTPLNTVINATALVDKAHLPAEQKDLLESAETNAQVLLGRVNDVLDVAAIDRGLVAFHIEPFLLSSVMQAVRGVCMPQAISKAVSLDLIGVDDFPEVFAGDPARVEQVVSNLVSNAIKFTPSGGSVTLRLQRGEVDAAGRLHLNVQVADTGIGIPDAAKDSIFKPFHRSHGSDARAQSGVGLGLYIVKAVSEQMGGRVEVADNEGGGTKFSWALALPLAAPHQILEPSVPLREALERHRAAVMPMKCLIFEDNLPNRQIIRCLLELAGHEIEFAAPGSDAVENLASCSPDVVLLDLHMPGRSGWDVIAELKARPGVGQLPPIAIISADSDPGTMAACLRQGAVAYLTKPIIPHKLLALLQGIGSSRAVIEIS